MCPGCARHVRVDEPRCPFCEAPLSGLAPAADMPPSMRLSRRAMFAVSASISALLFAPAAAQAHANVLAQRGAQRRPGFGMGYARYGAPPAQPAYGVSPITGRGGTVSVSDVRVNGAADSSHPWTRDALAALPLMRRRYSAIGDDGPLASPVAIAQVEISVRADGRVSDVRVTGTQVPPSVVRVVTVTYRAARFSPNGAAGTVHLRASFHSTAGL